MRYDMDWQEPRFPMKPRLNWSRVGSSVLALAIAGAGVGGAVRIVRAQDAAPPPLAAPAPESPAAAPAPESPAAAPAPAIALPALAAPQDAPAFSGGQQSELDALLKERARLEEKIAALRGRSYSYQGSSRALTPQERKAVDEALRTAREAMRLAQQAMTQAQRAMPSLPQMPFLDGKTTFITPNFTTPNTYGKNFPFLNGKGFPFYFYDKSQKNPNYDRLLQDWNKNQPEFDRRMREFETKMGQWQRDFERQMRERFNDKNFKPADPLSGKGDAKGDPLDAPDKTEPGSQPNDPSLSPDGPPLIITVTPSLPTPPRDTDDAL